MNEYEQSTNKSKQVTMLDFLRGHSKQLSIHSTKCDTENVSKVLADLVLFIICLCLLAVEIWSKTCS